MKVIEEKIQNTEAKKQQEIKFFKEMIEEKDQEIVNLMQLEVENQKKPFFSFPIKKVSQF